MRLGDAGGDTVFQTYRGTHQDINMLMLFPWPDEVRLSVHSGQLGRMHGLTWRQYLAAIGAFWERNSKRYPKHLVEVDSRLMTREQLTEWGQFWGLAVRAMLERGYLQLDGTLTPPVPFNPPPPPVPDDV